MKVEEETPASTSLAASIIPPIVPTAIVPPIAPIPTIPPPQLATLPVQPTVFKPPQNGEIITCDSDSDQDELGTGLQQVYMRFLKRADR